MAESESFRKLVNNLVSERIEEDTGVDDRPGGGYAADEAAGPPATITVAVAVYEVRVPAPGLSPGSAQIPVTPLTALAPIPAKATKRRRSGSREFLLLAEGTLMEYRIDGEPPGQWVPVSH